MMDTKFRLLASAAILAFCGQSQAAIVQAWLVDDFIKAQTSVVDAAAPPTLTNSTYADTTTLNNNVTPNPTPALGGQGN